MGASKAPDLVANLRVDQAWGSAQFMGALHQVNAAYYLGAGGSGSNSDPTHGHPGDKLGFAIGAGVKLNAPMIGQGDYLQAQINYTPGALRYIFQTPNSNWGKVQGQNEGFGLLSDAVCGGAVADGVAADLALTTAWNVNAAYEHFWNPRWRTSLYGGYASVTYSERGNAMACVGEGAGTGFGTTDVANLGCNNNWSTWWLGSRTQWNVTKDFYMGFDVLYSKLLSASLPGNLTSGVSIGGATNVSDVDNWQFRFRVHRDFYP